MRTFDKRQIPKLNFEKYLTQGSNKPKVNKGLPVTKKLNNVLSAFSKPKYSKIQTSKIFCAESAPLKQRPSPKEVHCRSVNDIKAIDGCKNLLCDCSYTSKSLRKLKVNKKEFRDLQLAHQDLNRQLSEGDQALGAERRKVVTLEAELEKLKSEMQTLKLQNTELQKKVNIADNADEIQHVINELSSLMLSSDRSINFSDKQLKTIKYLFGDVATQAYKDRIKILEDNLDAKTRENVDLKDELKTMMRQYVDDIQKIDKNSVPIENIRERLAKENVQYDSEILYDCLNDYHENELGSLHDKKAEILNRLSELNYESSTKPDTEFFLSIKKPKNTEIDTFMLELDQLEKLSTKQINDNRPNSSRLESDRRVLFSRVSLRK